MKVTLHPSASSLSARLCMLLAVIITASVSATDLTTQKLYGKWSLPSNDYSLGAERNTAVLTPKWIVLGDHKAKDRSVANDGGVQVFNAVTGAWVRKLLPPGAAAVDQYFGCSVAVSGDIAVVGSYGTNSSRGLAHIFNLASGALLRTLSASDGVAGDTFGFNVATNGVIAAVGAHGDDTSKGSVYLFNVATGLQIAKLQAFDAAINNYFGFGLALEGNVLAVGADGNNGDKGAVYFYDLTTQALIKKYQPGAFGPSFQMGSALAMQGGKVVIGNFDSGKVFLYDLANDSLFPLTLGGFPDSSFGYTVAISGPLVAVSEKGFSAGQGRVHLFKSSDGSFVDSIVPPNGDTSLLNFGYSIALDGTTLLVTAPGDSVQAPTAGAAHLIKPLTQPMDFVKRVAQTDTAPDAPDINYGIIGDVCINSDGEIAFSSKLTGANSNAGRDFGVFSDIKTFGTQQLLFKTRQSYSAPAVFGTPSMISANDTNLVIGLSTLTGTGVTALNNQLLWAKTNLGQSTLIRTGTAFVGAGLAGAVPQAIFEPVTSNVLGLKGMAAICTLRVGTGGVTAANDSALYSNTVGTSEESLREGAVATGVLPGGSTLGQFAPRLALNFESEVYSTAITGPGITAANNAAVFKKAHGILPNLVAQKGEIAPDALSVPMPGVTYSAFIGESANGDDSATFRATIAGTGVTAANNEGVWVLNSAPSRRLTFRKGQSLVTPVGVKIARIINFWAMGYDLIRSQCLALVQLSGTGVTAANDQALMAYQTDGSLLMLMREGDPAPGCPGATIGVISRVEADAYGCFYAVLVTLAGATPTNDQALYTGNIVRGDTTTKAQLRRPFLRLRKGQLFDNQPGKVKSIALPVGSVTASGAGGTGRGRAISWNGDLALVVEFENGIRQIVTGSAY